MTFRTVLVLGKKRELEGKISTSEQAGRKM
jgi:hypothetical protein